MVKHKRHGRLPRERDQRVPHYSSLIAGRRALLSPRPDECSWMSHVTQAWGVMLNNQLGDCTCAGLGHGVQITSSVSGAEITPTDDAILMLYEQACGYVWGNAATDKGGSEQSVLKYVMQHGIPTGDKNNVQVIGFTEIDPRNANDLRQVIYENGWVYLGGTVYESWEQTDHWVAPHEGDVPAGGHCWILGGYDAELFYGVSWGDTISIEPAAISAAVDEAYAVTLGTWLNPDGATLAGLPGA